MPEIRSVATALRGIPRFGNDVHEVQPRDARGTPRRAFLTETRDDPNRPGHFFGYFRAAVVRILVRAATRLIRPAVATADHHPHGGVLHQFPTPHDTAVTNTPSAPGGARKIVLLLMLVIACGHFNRI